MKDGICKIADFGFAKQNKNSLVLNKTVLGTPLYMSPEILNGKLY